MPLTQKQLALILTLALGVVGTQYALARGDIERDSEWFEPVAVNGEKHHFEPAIPAPGDFYFANHATSRNGLSVAHVLDAAVEKLLASGELDQWEQEQLENYGLYLSTLEPGRLGAVLEQLAGSQNANLGTVTQNSMKQLNANLLSAIRQLDADTDEAGRVWVKALGSSGKLDAQHGSTGLKQRNQGLLLGADWSLDHAWRIGVVGGKSGSNLNAKRFQGELDSWHLGAYAVRQDGPLALRMGALYSSHVGNNKREVDFDFINYREHLSGKYKAQSQNAFAELGYRLNTAGLQAEPFAGIGFARYQRGRFKEKGGDSALNVGAQTQQNLSSTFGLRLSHDFALDNQMSLKPHLSTSWTHLYGDVDSRLRQSSAWGNREKFNSEFTVHGTALDRNSLALRTGLDMTLSAEHSIGLAYTAEFGSSSRNQGLMGQWAMAF
ncbi:autotransporter outer membrane beta-barrel domain-containing protein [Pseudomonas poae]|uniref:Autotransporter outer membrane beta-barrel domain-containing protein n=1 Tax=Pseudomonas poae TaxID=200451 RepID=A0A2S9EWJ7_9PSED|nr:autotransporter outer membrane beta-barrel domain-containing protein [Pseudomonas poae]PRA27039.1 autotransporter outer membrane beta-barrel domain-containing protein [Pseudomonas poae]PRC20968.1 autotransporter outer membrane beta-barrel domain-containing protein [Pseudomonas poae]